MLSSARRVLLFCQASGLDFLVDSFAELQSQHKEGEESVKEGEEACHPSEAVSW